jgi:hypothetical protein
LVAATAAVVVVVVVGAPLLLGRGGTTNPEVADPGFGPSTTTQRSGETAPPDGDSRCGVVPTTTLETQVAAEEVLSGQPATGASDEFFLLMTHGLPLVDFEPRQPREVADQAELGVVGTIVAVGPVGRCTADGSWRVDPRLIRIEIAVEEVLKGLAELPGEYLTMDFESSGLVPWHAIDAHLPDERVVVFLSRDDEQRYRTGPQEFLVEDGGRLRSVVGDIEGWAVDTVDDLRIAIS